MSTPSPPETETESGASGLFASLRTVSLLTLLSRVLGLVRDMAMAAAFGNGAILDAFTVAFRVPNLARRLFGEGALTAAFLPVFVRELEGAGEEAAWKLASGVLNALAVTLCALVLAGEAALWLTAQFVPAGEGAALLVGLTAVMLPYLLLICIAAQIAAVLHALGNFTTPALLPILLNTVWIASLWLLAARFSSKTAQIYVVAASVVVGGVLQLALLAPALAREGFRYVLGWRSAGAQLAGFARAMLPVVVGLSVTQVNTLSDSLIAWGLSQSASGSQAAATDHPFALQAGTASALYFGQRMYQFPLGIFGVALGTVLFPVLSRHASRGRLDRLRGTLQLGLRLVMFVGLPASVGLVLLAQPITTLLFQRGAFDAADARQTVQMVAAYAIGVWAFCGLLIVHRGYYSVGDRQTPLRIGLGAVAVNLALNFALLALLGGRGLALATAGAAIGQFLGAAWFIQTRIGRFHWPGLGRAALRTAAATTLMALACLGGQQLVAGSPETFWGKLALVAVPLAVAVAVYLAAARLLGMDELWLLLRRRREPGEG